MPELPEVEVVTRGLRELIAPPAKIKSVQFLRKNLRSEFPEDADQKLRGQTILNLERRAKYILIETDDSMVISHLGMTGSWRLAEVGEEPGLHDHILLTLADGRTLIFRDPRRFGVFDLLRKNELESDRRFKSLGPEPFDRAFDAEYLKRTSKGRKLPIKNFIMDQRIVVGVGNIYAAEALYRAGLSPLVQAGRVSTEKYKILVNEIRKVLKRAINSGGSTIRNFAGTYGDSGSFQKTLKVYGRRGQPCPKCGTEIKSKVLSGRSTFWCVKCQK